LEKTELRVHTHIAFLFTSNLSPEIVVDAGQSAFGLSKTNAVISLDLTQCQLF